jgi:flavin reductase (DIM6/NTAB) family NADH-FMN oxidoreductase RutF
MVGAAATHDDYRLLMSGFPTGVAVITALDGDGHPHGLTCTSLSSVTLAPPTLLVCLNTNSGTLAAVRCSHSFAVNLLHSQGRKAATVFSSNVVDRFGLIAWRPTPVIESVWLHRDAFAVAECKVSQIIPVGDHEVVLGEVVNIVYASATPLLYGMRQFSSWHPELTGSTEQRPEG